MHQVYDGFHFVLKKTPEMKAKIDFLAHFERFLVYTFLRPMSSTTIFFKLNVLWRYIIVVSSLRAAFVVVKLQIFKCCCGNVESMKWPFLGAFWTFSPANMTRVC